MQVQILRSVAAAALAVLASTATAQTLEADEVVVFDGQSRLDYPGSPALVPGFPATLEFWIAPAWQDPLAYDPCVVSSMGLEQVNYAVHIGADRQSIGLFVGDRHARLPFDFSDGRMHHVALLSYGPELTEVRINGASVGTLGLGLGNGPSLSFHLGSLDAEQAPLVGALARVRLWDSLLDEQTPPENLRAQSLFVGDQLSLAVYPREEVDPAPLTGPATEAPGRRTLSPVEVSR